MTRVIERPILFSTKMVQAILNLKVGQWPAAPIDSDSPFKWQTRRVIKLPEGAEGCILAADGSCDIKFYSTPIQTVNLGRSGWIRSPYGKPGDHLWVRETWRKDDYDPSNTIYKADMPDQVLAEAGDLIKWRPSIFMPRTRSRITLEVVSIAVGRVQEITPDDVIAEGIRIPYSNGTPLLRLTGKYPPSDYLKPGYSTDDFIRAHFASGWDAINACRGFGWDKNNYVRVVSFKRIK